MQLKQKNLWCTQGVELLYRHVQICYCSKLLCLHFCKKCFDCKRNLKKTSKGSVYRGFMCVLLCDKDCNLLYIFRNTGTFFRFTLEKIRLHAGNVKCYSRRHVI
jgi:hypothetical protein